MPKKIIFSTNIIWTIQIFLLSCGITNNKKIMATNTVKQIHKEESHTNNRSYVIRVFEHLQTGKRI